MGRRECRKGEVMKGRRVGKRERKGNEVDARGRRRKGRRVKRKIKKENERKDKENEEKLNKLRRVII